ncbi:putative UbiD family decarboxylase [Colletotrichum karsti]|uniref:UbiD family decarboxylase n=1 Tax=Colletotrichum karsti TaxID=1095194 RepID=A0A9P6LI64_9PEZI|nr:putative UbiD family decarboxylase [Colletotrichum karsti]KAF9877004.1 putative UbiD family decarboxylase [Colletotrichum karsti]
MTRSKSLAAAEMKALEGKNESQDSQYVLDQYKALYGIGVVHEQLASEASINIVATQQSRLQKPPRVALDGLLRSSKSRDQSTHFQIGTEYSAASHSQSSVALIAVDATDAGGQDRGPDPQTTSACSAPIESSDAANFLRPALPTKSHGNAVDSQPDIVPAPCAPDETSLPKEKVNLSPRSSHPPSRKKRKMDVSQQSPTQENDERDYENYFDGPSFVETSPISQDPTSQHHAIHDDDSGAVHFDLSHLQNETQVDEEPSSIPEDSGLATGRGNWRRSSSQQHSSLQRPDGESPLPPTAPPPQTPAQNPFAGMKKLGDPALVGSQLFGQTQFSSAVKRFSPTSSRPSPHGYIHNSISPNLAETSPLKNRFNVTSPSEMFPSSPQAIRIEPLRAEERERSPSDSGQPDDGTVPESPQYAPVNKRARPEPMDNYENMLESQKRKLSMEAEDNLSGEDSDDVADALRRRRRLAASKQEAASKELTSISVGRRSDRRSVEVPSTTKKPRERRPRRYQAQRADKDSNASGDDNEELTVADSQDQAGAKQSASRPSGDKANPRAVPQSGLVSSNEAIPDSTGATQKSIPSGVVPGTESSDNSSRPKDIIPETSPTNTQSRADAKVRASSDEPLVAPKPEAVKNSVDPATTEMQDPEAEIEAEEVQPDTSPVAPLQPSRRSGRKSRPTPKAQDLNDTARTAKASEYVSAEMHSSVDKESAEEAAAAQEKSVVEDLPASRSVPTTEGRPYIPSSPPVPRGSVRKMREPGLSTPDQGNGAPAPHERNSHAAPDPPGSTSTLSVLTTTPVPSDKTSPATQESVELPPLSPQKPTRGRQATKRSTKATASSRVSKPGTRRQSRRSMRLDSASTDELTRSPSVTGFENSIIQPPKSTARGSRLSMLSHTSKDGNGPKMFAGMAFAISFQSKKEGERADQYEHRLGQSRDIEKMIVQSGGHLLKNGFDELFGSNALKSRSTSPASDGAEDTPLTLTPWAQTMGFTALIADGHSRKVKYMQALALGLPCISDRWVATCVAKGTVVDWLPYLLCAGQSAFLRDAVRSRNLVPYSATEAQLNDVIEARPKMLEGSKILLVMKKSRAEDKKMPYVFLAHVLGASLTRTYSQDEARDLLKQKEELNEPFDWVYVDEHTGNEEGLFSSAVAETKPSKKRKRAAVPVKDDAGQPPKRIRTLNDELVIQSLILGRMIEEGELEA